MLQKTFIKSLAFEYDIVFPIDLNSKRVPIHTTNLEWKFLWWAFHLQFKLCSSLFHAQCPHTSSRKYSRQSLKDFPKLLTYFSSVHLEIKLLDKHMLHSKIKLLKYSFKPFLLIYIIIRVWFQKLFQVMESVVSFDMILYNNSFTFKISVKCTSENLAVPKD